MDSHDTNRLFLDVKRHVLGRQVVHSTVNCSGTPSGTLCRLLSLDAKWYTPVICCLDFKLYSLQTSILACQVVHLPIAVIGQQLIHLLSSILILIDTLTISYFWHQLIHSLSLIFETNWYTHFSSIWNPGLHSPVLCFRFHLAHIPVTCCEAYLAIPCGIQGPFVQTLIRNRLQVCIVCVYGCVDCYPPVSNTAAWFHLISCLYLLRQEWMGD